MDNFSVQHERLGAKPAMSRTGRAIAKRIAHHDQDIRALIARALVTGEPIPAMSHRKAAKLTVVSRHRLAAAELATVGEIECVQLGRLSLRHVRRAHALKALTDAEIEDFIDRAGPNRVLAILDSMTAPVAMAAE
jgi:hypothetical protein